MSRFLNEFMNDEAYNTSSRESRAENWKVEDVLETLLCTEDELSQIGDAVSNELSNTMVNGKPLGDQDLRLGGNTRNNPNTNPIIDAMWQRISNLNPTFQEILSGGRWNEPPDNHDIMLGRAKQVIWSNRRNNRKKASGRARANAGSGDTEQQPVASSSQTPAGPSNTSG